MPPDCDPDGDEAEETQPGKAKKCDSKRDCHIEQPETGKKRQDSIAVTISSQRFSRLDVCSIRTVLSMAVLLPTAAFDDLGHLRQIVHDIHPA